MLLNRRRRLVAERFEGLEQRVGKAEGSEGHGRGGGKQKGNEGASLTRPCDARLNAGGEAFAQQGIDHFVEAAFAGFSERAQLFGQTGIEFDSEGDEALGLVLLALFLAVEDGALAETVGGSRLFHVPVNLAGQAFVEIGSFHGEARVRGGVGHRHWVAAGRRQADKREARLPPREQQATLQMVRVGKLVEDGGSGDLVSVLQGGDVVEQGLLVAGNVQNAVEAAGQFERHGVQPAARRVDEQRGVAEGLEVDVLESRECFAAGQCIAEFLARHAGDGDIIDVIGGQIVLGGMDG